MAIPKEHMRRFHGMDDAKEIWEAIRTRFGGNANSKKMQKAIFKQQFEAFTISSSEGLEKGYDTFQQLLSQLEAHGAENVDTLSIDDLYNNLDTLSVLGKFDGKSNEGFLVGYSLNSKAYRVYNLVTKRVEVNLHVNFLEDKPNVKGVGYRWMFDIDYLTDSMNYIPVSLENQANPHAGTLEVTNSAGTSQTPNSNAFEEKDKDVELIVMPSAVKNTTEKVETRKSSTNSKKEEFFKAPQQENEASSTGTSKDNPKILAFRRELEEIAQKHLGIVPENNSTSTSSQNISHILSRDMIYLIRLSYDEEGVVTDFNSLPTVIEDSPTPTLRIYNIYPKSQILSDHKSAVQTRSKVQGKIRISMHLSSIFNSSKEKSQSINNIICLPVFYLRRNLKRFMMLYKMTVGFKPCKRSFYSLRCNRIRQLVSQPPGYVDPNHPTEGFIRWSKLCMAASSKLLSKLCYSKNISREAWIQEGLQVKQNKEGIFISQDKYVAEILKKFDLVSVKTTKTPMETKMALTKDEEAVDVDVHLYRSMIEIVDFLRGSNLGYALTNNPTIHDSLVKQFWQTATAKTLVDGTLELKATINTIEYTITEASIRSKLQLADASGITMLPNKEIFEGWEYGESY
ncbi:ribonuclease H-like domain-containing protein [Tanacetum coccineum]